MNGSDCGMFACKYADCITKDKPINFTQVSLIWWVVNAVQAKVQAILMVLSSPH